MSYMQSPDSSYNGHTFSFYDDDRFNLLFKGAVELQSLFASKLLILDYNAFLDKGDSLPNFREESLLV